MTLAKTLGVGERLAQKITDHFGTEDRVRATLRSGDVARLAEVDGVSLKRALSMARQYAGADGSFLATKEAERLHHELIVHLQGFTACAASKERMGLLMPAKELEPRRSMISAAMTLPSEWLNEQQQRWSKLGRLKEPKGRYERVIVSPEPLDHLKRFCRVLVPSEHETWKDYTVFNTITWVGTGAPMSPPDGWLVTGNASDEATLLPERVIDWFSHNATVLNLVCETVASWKDGSLPANDALQPLMEALQPLRELPEAMALVGESNQAGLIASIRDELWTFVKTLEQEVNLEVESAMNDAKMALSGAELLEALADGAAFQRKLRDATGDVIAEAMQKARERLAAFIEPAKVKCPYDIFTSSWPAKLDRQAIDGVDAALESNLNTATTDHLVQAAHQLGPLKLLCEAAVQQMIELDQWCAIARWSVHDGCVLPQFGEHGIALVEGRHVLLGVTPDPVTYGLGHVASQGDRQSLALLTGANSGGKTTLLECLAHACILAHMGLPVPAHSARVGRVDALHILAKAGGTQSAGALEQTLVELADVVSDPAPKLILADELEAITEPGAGARIIAGMLLAAESQAQTTMMLVTHLAPSIIEASGRDDLRVDGIEARGLGEDLELVVDRTPRRNHLARSTPELIVRRLVEKSTGQAKDLFKDILGRFET
ncbi:MAG: hypothetical protein DWC07_02025 [Candidatus Poseidoniales archaeon]|nr:MAG: hypothetical protein DWC07_02025 [Candidatus Poseidoniales archaeon]